MNKSIQLAFKDVDRKKGIVTGYLSAFNVLDSDGDIVMPGAFKKSIMERGPESKQPRIKWFYNHKPDMVPGVFSELKEDDYGLLYVGQTGTHDFGKDFMKMVESGIITEHSHGFRTIKEERKGDANYMHELFLMEGSSLSAGGANQHTPLVGSKSQKDLLPTIELIEKFCKNSDATDECLYSLEMEIKELKQLIQREPVATTHPTEPTIITQPDEKELILTLQLINKRIKLT